MSETFVEGSGTYKWNNDSCNATIVYNGSTSDNGLSFEIIEKDGAIWDNCLPGQKSYSIGWKNANNTHYVLGCPISNDDIKELIDYLNAKANKKD